MTKVAALSMIVVVVCAGDALAQRRGWGGGRGWGSGWGYGGYGGYWGGYYYPSYYSNTPYYYDYGAYPNTNYSESNSYYPPTGNNDQGMDKNAASIEVRVPENAKVFFDDQPTQQKGSERFFTTPSIPTGKTWAYHVRATWNDSNGQPVTRERDIQVTPGARQVVNFLENQGQNPNQNQIPDRNPKQNPDQNPKQNPNENPIR
jgi:uncharacterized protein (TIGR03000 family)